MKNKSEIKEFLTVKEVSLLVGINEKKIYALVQQGRLPGTKVTGKWLFPRVELEEMIRREARAALGRSGRRGSMNSKIILAAGSDDPLLYFSQGLFHRMYPDFALYLSSVGSGEGLKFLKNGLCTIALSHLYEYDSDDYNFPFIRTEFTDPQDLVVLNLFYRNVGFVSRSFEAGSFREVAEKKLRFINRQVGSGIRNRIERMIAEENLQPHQISGYENEVFTHLDVADHIVRGNADAGIATQSAALYANLHFHKLFEERFDMVTYKDTFFQENVQAFVEFIRSDTFLRLLHSVDGYDSRSAGKIMYQRMA
jgi:excisionase family DNA binding protein